MRDVPVILLAAGESSRMGSPKQLLDFQGKALLRHAVDTALAAAVGRVVVVVGAAQFEVCRVLAGLPIDVVLNDRWDQGMGTSINQGVAHAITLQARGVILALADQPFVTAEFFRSLIDRQVESAKAIIAARYSGTFGVPAFFAAELFGRLVHLPPHMGCKRLIEAYAEQVMLIDCPAATLDIDTPEDYAKAITLTPPSALTHRSPP